MSGSRPIQNKLARLSGGHPPRVLDLFAGCGGLTLGFTSAGFSAVGAIENDNVASATYGRNFHDGHLEHTRAHDINQITPLALAKSLGLGPLDSSVDVIVGGPPCQAFARVGRPKLREVDAHPEAFKHDPRAQLYLKYLEYVNAFQPLALLMENVPDVLNHGGQNIPEEICGLLETKGYVASYTLLNAAHYGVPQMRERMFLIAYRNEVANKVVFPAPTHWIALPRGYDGTRSVAMKVLNASDLFGPKHHYVPTPKAHPGLAPAVTAAEAIGDLPPITLHLKGELTRGARRFTAVTSYGRRRKLSAYASLMRNWPGFESLDGIRDHVIRYLPRDWKIFARMSEGDQYPEAHRLAERMLDEELARLKKSGRTLKRSSEAFRDLRAQFVPPYDAGKFPNKWRKMWRDQPARTLMAHLGKDSYSHIHYDDKQARTISVREAARLQSFPDGFLFEGTMNPAFRQIGNAVPPLLAKAIALEIARTLSAAGANYASEDSAKAAVSV